MSKTGIFISLFLVGLFAMILFVVTTNDKKDVEGASKSASDLTEDKSPVSSFKRYKAQPEMTLKRGKNYLALLKTSCVRRASPGLSSTNNI